MSKFDKDTKDKVIYAVSKGATFQLACDYACISYQTLRNWMVAGEKQRDLPKEEQNAYLDFFDDVKRAQGAMAIGCLERIEAAGLDGQWTADAWKLERIHSKYYARDAVIHEFREELEKLKLKQAGGLEYEDKDTNENHIDRLPAQGEADIKDSQTS